MSGGNIDVSGLCVTGRDEAGAVVPILTDVGFTIARGEVLSLIGESGSGKTTAGLALMGYARRGCTIAAGHIRVGGTDVRALSPAALAAFRGRKVSYVAQSAAAAFNPAHRIIEQVIEPALIHQTMTRAAAEAKAHALFHALSLPDPVGVGQRFPHQVSGGQLQRLMAAMALINDPELVILDEPTTALDVTTQIDVLRAFKSVVRDLDTTALYVSHDLSVVAQIADTVVVMRDGRVQEAGSIRHILGAAEHPYTRLLLAAAVPALRPIAEPEPAPPVLEVGGLTAGYGRMDKAGVPAFPVLHDIGFSIAPGSVFGVIGESGCGKSTLAQVIAGLLPAAQGTIRLNGEILPPRVEDRARAQLQAMQIVFQMADVALNPARTVGAILARPLTFYHGLRGAARDRRVTELLDMVRLPPDLAARYPGELSGGQKQRVNLARALAAKPSLILCDEVTSALDTVVGAAILDLLAELRKALGVALMFISHDITTVRAICDQVMILYAGRSVEFGGGGALDSAPVHPYTGLLLSSVPELRAGWLDGLGPATMGEAGGGLSMADTRRPCPFFRRCAVRLPGICDIEPPPIRHLTKGSRILCHRSEDDLIGLSQGSSLYASDEASVRIE